MRIFAYLGLAFFLLPIGCGKDDPISPNNDIIISDNTVLPEENAALQQVVVGEGSLAFTYEQGATLPTFNPGDILVGATGLGYLRTVVSQTVQGSTIQVTTEQAALEDVVTRGSFDTTFTLVPTSQALAPLRVDTLMDGRHVIVTSDAGALAPMGSSFQLEFPNLTITILGYATLHADRIVYRAHTTTNWDLQFDWGLEHFLYSISCQDTLLFEGFSFGFEESTQPGENPSSEIPLGTIPLGTFPLPTPWGPIVFTFSLDLKAGLSLSISLSDDATADASVTIYKSSTIGGEYANGDWNVIRDWNLDGAGSFDLDSPSALTADVKEFVKLSFECMVYGTAGLGVFVKPYLYENLTQSADPSTEHWEVGGGMEGGVSFRARFLKQDLIDFDITLTDEHWLWWSGGSQAPSVTITSPTNGQSFTQGTAITFQGAATDPQDGTLSGSALVWSSDRDGQIGTGTTVTASSLSANTHVITLTATDSDGNSSSDQITISVTSLTAPDIDVTPTSLQMTASAGGIGIATLTVQNAGNAPLTVNSITADTTWLSASPTNFTVAEGGSKAVTATANATSLGAGTYNGTITIASNDPDEATKTIGVTFTVTGGGTAEIDMLRINGGTFQMGSNSQWAYDREKPVHTVTVSSFYMSKFEVTQGQYEAVMGTDPSYFSGDNRPVERVTWWNAARFCNALSVSEGRTPCYNESDWSCNFSANGYRLPTEAEWEYACRAGTTTDYYSGNETQSGCSPLDPNLDLIGWYCGNASSQTHDVGGKQPNSFGLYDMSGNVWEWCNDWYGSYSSQAQTDPTGPSSGSYRVVRGGRWSSVAQYCRSAYRYYGSPGYSYDLLGFRLVRR